MPLADCLCNHLSFNSKRGAGNQYEPITRCRKGAPRLAFCDYEYPGCHGITLYLVEAGNMSRHEIQHFHR
jgi:hypothetical protein